MNRSVNNIKSYPDYPSQQYLLHETPLTNREKYVSLLNWSKMGLECLHTNPGSEEREHFHVCWETKWVFKQSMTYIKITPYRQSHTAYIIVV